MRASRYVVVPVFGHDSLSAVRTSVVFFQPGTDAVAMEPMLARKYCDFVTNVHAVHTDRAFCFAVGAHHGLIGRFLRQSSDSGSGGRTWSGTAAGLLHHLADDAVKGLFGVNDVSMSRICGVAELSQCLGEKVERVDLGRSPSTRGIWIIPVDGAGLYGLNGGEHCVHEGLDVGERLIHMGGSIVGRNDAGGG